VRLGGRCTRASKGRASGRLRRTTNQYHHASALRHQNSCLGVQECRSPLPTAPFCGGRKGESDATHSILEAARATTGGHAAPPSGAGGSAAANVVANPQPQPAGSQDNGHGKLVLPQLNHLHEAFKRSQVSHPVSYSSQEQQPTRRSSPIPSQRRLTQQLTSTGPNSMPCVSTTLARVLRSSASSTCLKSTRPRSRNQACAWR
jgi:hypothetical protein